MTEQEERFVHFVSSIENLNHARWILEEIMRHKGHPLVGPAFELALVEYSKPYTMPYGADLDAKGKPKHKHLLDMKYIPAKHRALHERILKARNKIYAHDDLSVKNAMLYVKNTQSGKFVYSVQNVIDPTDDLRTVDQIIDLIEQTLLSMYEEEKRLREQLPTNS